MFTKEEIDWFINWSTITDEEVELAKEALIREALEIYPLIPGFKLNIRGAGNVTTLDVIYDHKITHKIVILDKLLAAIAIRMDNTLSKEEWEELEAHTSPIKNFQIPDKDHTLHLSDEDGDLLLDGKPLHIVYYEDSGRRNLKGIKPKVVERYNDSYTPLTIIEEGNKNGLEDRILIPRSIHLPEDHLIPVVLTRDWFGVNLTFAILDTKRDIMFCRGFANNFDYPQGITVRQCPEDDNRLEIYLYNNDVSFKTIYENPDTQLVIELMKRKDGSLVSNHLIQGNSSGWYSEKYDPDLGEIRSKFLRLNRHLSGYCSER